MSLIFKDETSFSDRSAKAELSKNLRASVSRLTPKERFGFLLFDDFPALIEDTETTDATSDNSTHLIHFLLRGACKPYKQPIFNVAWSKNYYPLFLAQVISDIVYICMRAGITIIATVSSHSKLWVDAIQVLIERSDIPSGDSSNDTAKYEFKGNIIYHLYDPCRLMKTFRDALLKHDLLFEEVPQKTSIASWKHIVNMFALDLAREKRNLPNVTKEYVLKSFISKKNRLFEPIIKVFSDTFGQEMLHSIKNGQLEPETKTTANLILFMDKLFDTFNSTDKNPNPEKPLQQVLGNNSVHFEFWEKAIKIIESMRFMNEETKTVFRPPSLDKWLSNIVNIRHIWKRMCKSKIKYLPTRCFSLDVVNDMVKNLKYVQICKPANKAELKAELILSPEMTFTVMETLFTYFNHFDLDDDVAKKDAEKRAADKQDHDEDDDEDDDEQGNGKQGNDEQGISQQGNDEQGNQKMSGEKVDLKTVGKLKID